MTNIGDRIEQKRRQAIRLRAPETVRDCTKLLIQVSPLGGREVIRYLNDKVGMMAYEFVGYDPLGYGNMRQMEFYVPGKALALMIKLTWNGK